MLRFLPMLLAAAPAWAQDHSACYTVGSVPEGIRAATASEQTDVAGLSFGYHFIPLYMRRMCGFEDAQNEAYISEVLLQVGCSKDSTIGLQQTSVLKIDVSELGQAMAGCDLRNILEKQELNSLCADLSELNIVELASDAGEEPNAEAAVFHEIYERFEAMTQNIAKEDC